MTSGSSQPSLLQDGQQVPSPSHTAQDGSTCDPAPPSFRKGHNPSALFHTGQRSVPLLHPCPGCIPRSCREHRALLSQAVPGACLAVTQRQDSSDLCQQAMWLAASSAHLLIQTHCLLLSHHSTDCSLASVKMAFCLPCQARKLSDSSIIYIQGE